MGVYGKILHLLLNPVEISPQSSSKTPDFVLNVEMIEVSLSLVGQEVKIISPKICLH